MNENRNLKKGVGIHARRLIAYIVLIIVSILCLFWFYVLFINATRSNGELQSGFTLIPCKTYKAGSRTAERAETDCQ